MAEKPNVGVTVFVADNTSVCGFGSNGAAAMKLLIHNHTVKFICFAQIECLTHGIILFIHHL